MATKPTPRTTTTSTKPPRPRFHAKILSDAMGKEEWDFNVMPTPLLKITILGLLVHVAGIYLTRGEERTQRRTIIDRTFIVKAKLTPEPHVEVSTKPAKVRTKRAR